MTLEEMEMPVGAWSMSDKWDSKHGPTTEEVEEFFAAYPKHAALIGLIRQGEEG